MFKLARALAVAAMVATTSLAGLATVAQAHPTDQPSAQARATVLRLLARERFSVPDAARPRLLRDEDRSTPLNLPNPTPAQRRLLAQQRYYSTWRYATTPAPAPPEPGGQAGWRTPALAGLAAVLALVAGAALLAARRTRRGHRAEQTA